MKHVFVLIPALVLSLLVSSFHGPAQGLAADCQFVLGFQTIYDLIPDTVGECVVDQHYNPENGDALQETTRGLMVWRKADNFTAFTDGYRSWVNGPEGLQERLNTERFPWEKDEPRRLADSQIVKDGKRDGQGELIIDNRGIFDVAITLTSREGDSLLVVYVRAKESFSVTGIPDGIYYVQHTFGEDWDSDSERFTLEKESGKGPAIFGSGPMQGKQIRVILGISQGLN